MNGGIGVTSRRGFLSWSLGTRFKGSVCGVILLALAGCTAPPSDSPADDRIPVFAGIAPVAYLVEQIGGPHVKVDVLVQPGKDPHTFEPDPQQIRALSKAAIFFEIGMPFERALLEKVQEGNPRLKVVDIAQGMQKRVLDTPCSEHSADHDEHPGSETGEPDPHVWLSPPLLKTQAQNIAKALGQADPNHQTDYQRNLNDLLARLDALHLRIQKMLAPYRGRTFYVFHPGFGYFADAYGLKEEAVEAGGREPPPMQLRELIQEAKRDRVRTIFVQPQSPARSAQVVADAIGGKVVTINGLGHDILEDMGDIATKIEAAMKEGQNGN
jgi:zinc transport system substrate-binding protein